VSCTGARGEHKDAGLTAQAIPPQMKDTSDWKRGLVAVLEPVCDVPGREDFDRVSCPESTSRRRLGQDYDQLPAGRHAPQSRSVAPTKVARPRQFARGAVRNARWQARPPTVLSRGNDGPPSNWVYKHRSTRWRCLCREGLMRCLAGCCPVSNWPWPRRIRSRGDPTRENIDFPDTTSRRLPPARKQYRRMAMVVK
jgi:hypothetical protein